MTKKTTIRKKTTKKAAVKTDAPTITIFRAAPGGAYHWRLGDSVNAKRYMARSQAERAALKAHPDATLVHEPDPPKPDAKKKGAKASSAAKHDAAFHTGTVSNNQGRPVEVAIPKDEDAPATKSTGKATPTDPRSRNHVSLLDAAAMILADAKEPMQAKQIVDAVIERGLWKPGTGKTPHATLYAAMTREIAKKGEDARFRKVGRGQFETGKGA